MESVKGRNWWWWEWRKGMCERGEGYVVGKRKKTERARGGGGVLGC